MSERMNEEFMNGLEEFKDFFMGSKKAFGQKDSESYTRVKEQFMNSYNTITALQDQAVTQENSKQMFEARNALTEICESYIRENNDRMIFTGTGQKRMNTIKNVLGHLKKDDFSQLRDPRAVEQYVGRNWNEIKEMPMAKVEIDAMDASAGGAASERFLINYDGKNGFFTPQAFVQMRNDAVKKEIEKIDNLETKMLIEKNMSTLNGDSFAYDFARAYERGALPMYCRKVGMLKALDEMPDKTEEEKNQKSNFYKLLCAEGGFAPRLDKVITEYQAKFDKDLDEKGREDLFNKCLEKVETKYHETLKLNREAICSYAENNELITETLTGDKAAEIYIGDHMYSKMAMSYSKKDYESYNMRKSFMTNNEIKNQGLQILKKGVAAEKPTNGEFGELHIGAELSGRNTASSRLAEAFGVGNLLAHSKDMTINVDGKEIAGCFMEFAEGIDMRNCKGENLERLSKVELSNTPGFTKDMCNLEILDYICAQSDRHAGNIFLKLDENNRPIGLQGIDNDLSLSDFSKKYPGQRIPMKQGELKDLHFMSEDMAKKIQNIKPQDLKRLVGDKISESELEALQGRVKDVQEHIKNNVFLVKNDEDWSLDNYDNLIKPTNLQGPKKEKEAKELFEKARGEIEDGLNLDNKNMFNAIHQNTNILNEINNAKERYKKELEANKEAEVNKEAEANKEAESNQKIEEEREKKEEKQDMTPKPEHKLPENNGHKLNRPEDAVEEKTDAKVENLKEDGTEKVKEYEDGKKVKVVSGENNQFIRSETGYKTQEEKKQPTSLFGLMKESHDKNVAAQRDANEREANIKAKKEEIRERNQRENPVKDETGKIREMPKTPEKGQSAFDIMKNASRQNREQAKVNKGVQIGGHREKDNSFKAEIDRSKERKTNLKLGAHRENVGMLDHRSKKDALKQDQGMKDNRSKKDVLKGGPKK